MPLYICVWRCVCLRCVVWTADLCSYIAHSARVWGDIGSLCCCSWTLACNSRNCFSQKDRQYLRTCSPALQIEKEEEEEQGKERRRRRRRDISSSRRTCKKGKKKRRTTRNHKESRGGHDQTDRHCRPLPLSKKKVKKHLRKEIDILQRELARGNERKEEW